MLHPRWWNSKTVSSTWHHGNECTNCPRKVKFTASVIILSSVNCIYLNSKNVFLKGVCACMLSHFCCVPLFATLWTVAHQAPLSMGFSRQESWSKVTCPPPRDLPHPEIEPISLASPALEGGFFTTNATREAPKGSTLLHKQLRVCVLCRHLGLAFWGINKTWPPLSRSFQSGSKPGHKPSYNVM